MIAALTLCEGTVRRLDRVTVRSASTYLHLLGGLGPAVAALAVTAVIGGRSGVLDLLRRAVAWRGHLRWLAGFGEEIGWRGSAQPTLQRRHSPLQAAIVVSVIWAAWHLPLFGITATYRAMPALALAVIPSLWRATRTERPCR